MPKRSGSRVPVRTTKLAPEAPSGAEAWWPLERLHREIDSLFDRFGQGLWHMPFRRSAFDIEPLLRRELSWGASPAVDVVEKDKAFEITAELPGLDENDIEVTLANGGLSIKGEKQEETEEKEKDYYVHERRFGSFERWFDLPDSVDPDKVEASFSKGVLMVTLPKKAEAQKPAKKVKVKVAA